MVPFIDFLNHENTHVNFELVYSEDLKNKEENEFLPVNLK